MTISYYIDFESDEAGQRCEEPEPCPHPRVTYGLEQAGTVDVACDACPARWESVPVLFRNTLTKLEWPVCK